MEATAGVIVALGAAATTASTGALMRARRMKRDAGDSTWALTGFWGAVTIYSGFFTLLRAAAIFGDDRVLYALYLAQTFGGAATIVSLAAIVFALLLPRWGSGFATGMFMSLAILTVALILTGGARGPYVDAWSVELLPESAAARMLIAIVYVITPMVLSALILGMLRLQDASTRRRMRLFAASITLMFVPSAIKYVVLVEGVLNTLLAATFLAGTVAGWLAYPARAPEPAANPARPPSPAAPAPAANND